MKGYPPHPLKAITLLSWGCLVGFQFGLFWHSETIDSYWVLALGLPLLLPAKGLFTSNQYTYKWVGFLTLVYFSVGISELVSNPALRLYAFATTISSTLLFLSSIYYVRYLRGRGV